MDSEELKDLIDWCRRSLQRAEEDLDKELKLKRQLAAQFCDGQIRVLEQVINKLEKLHGNQ
jgi:ribosome-binding protein aMBF1 (putative translation factor)